MRIANSYTLNEYKKNYPLLLEKFLSEYEDNDEFMFATAEIKHFYNDMIDIPGIETGIEFTKEHIHKNVQSELGINKTLNLLESGKKHNLSSFKIIDFLESKLNSEETRTPTTETTLKNSLNWQGTALQFTELTKALIESNLISPELTEKERFKRLKQFFNIEEFNESDKIKEIVNRTNTPTPFINILEVSLNNYRNNQLEKRKNK
jgi:hypothetical protein